jgi:hypothetical protein
MIYVQIGKYKLNRSGLGQEKHYIFVIFKPFLFLRRGKFAQDHDASSSNLGFAKWKRKLQVSSAKFGTVPIWYRIRLSGGTDFSPWQIGSTDLCTFPDKYG